MSNACKSHDVLSKVQVAKPCPANWREMRGDDRVRHCTHCSLNVYNLSAMSRVEAANLIQEHEGKLCVRFYARQDGTVLTKDCGKPISQSIRFGRIGLAIVGILGLGSMVAANQLSTPHEASTHGLLSSTLTDWQATVLRFFGVEQPSSAVMGDIAAPTTIGKLAVPITPRVSSSGSNPSPTKASATKTAGKSPSPVKKKS